MFCFSVIYYSVGYIQSVGLQCVKLAARCDGVTQCTDSSDEDECAKVINSRIIQLSPPAIVTLDGRGGVKVTAVNLSALAGDPAALCPDTHFRCPGGGYCLPVYVRCNGVDDCPGREDEAGCASSTCPGFYRCRASTVCLHAQHVCDGVFQCPRQDDELYCHPACSPNCTCYGLAATCREAFPAFRHPDLRFLDASGTGMSQFDLAHNAMLVHLSLASCRLQHVRNFTFPNLRSLDLSNNSVTHIAVGHLRAMPSLRTLVLSRNPLASLFYDYATSSAPPFRSLRHLDLSQVRILKLSSSVFQPFPGLHVLNLSACDVEETDNFRSLAKLRVLDLRGCPVSTFPGDVFEGLDKLQALFADNYKLCCPATLPHDFALGNCLAPFNELSSCDALLRSDIYRVFLAVFAVLSLLGNLGSFVSRVFVHRTSNESGFAIFVTHLCLSDFLMGLYLAMVGVADRLYRGSYVLADSAWRHSAVCKAAGFLSLLSSEVSAFLICLITLDRFLVLRFPFSTVRFNKPSASWACLLVWLTGMALATAPLLPWTAHWRFYSQTGICIPLPVTRSDDFAGQHYAFAVVIVVNFVLFMLIAAGQAFVYISIRANRMSASECSKKSVDASIARRLITVAMSDFLCWFPIGLLGLLAAQDVAVPSEVSVAMAILVLPVNSALNPFLYTLNRVLEHRRRAQELKLKKLWMARAAASDVSVAPRG